MIDDPLALPPLLQSELISEALAEQKAGPGAQPDTYPLLADEARRAGVPMHDFAAAIIRHVAMIKAAWIARP